MSGQSRPLSKLTLVELLIIAVFLGTLAWMVVPQLSPAAGDVGTSALAGSLSAVRSAIELYRIDHGGSYPAMRTFVEQMTLASRSDGGTAPAGTQGYPLGPYLQNIPVNPATRTNTIGQGPAGSSAWYYNEATGEFRANDSGQNRAM